MSGTQKDIGILPFQDVQATPDGAASRAAYNEAHGRAPKAPTQGDPRQEAYDALLSKSGEKIPSAFRK